MSAQIEFDDFFPNSRLAFVEQPPSNEDSIIVSATFAYPLLGGWPVSHEKGKPPLLVKNWPHSYPIEDGFLRLRLSMMNDDNGENFCDFNINRGNSNDYIEVIGYINDNFLQKFGDENMRPIVNNIIEGELENPLHFVVWKALTTQNAKIVTDSKSVFCLVPAPVSKLIDMGVKDMKDTTLMSWDHQNKQNHMMSIGWYDDCIKIPSVEMGGLSNLCIQPTEDAYNSIFNNPNTQFCPYQNDDSQEAWIRETVRKYLSLHDAQPLKDEEMKLLIQSINSLYTGY